jgi:ATPase subunit of ABC transporter with duplicated ATPase domains
LDEPTNHLDFEGISWLEKFLNKADFAVLFVSHDRSFIRSVATRILELDRGKALLLDLRVRQVSGTKGGDIVRGGKTKRGL